MEYWRFTASYFTRISLQSDKATNLEREGCNKPNDWKTAMRWNFTTRNSFFLFLSKLAYGRPFTDSQPEAAFHFFFFNALKVFFSQHAEGTSGPSHTTRRHATPSPGRKKGEKGFSSQFWDIPKHLFTVKNKQTNKNQPSKVLLQSFWMFFHSFGVYI